MKRLVSRLQTPLIKIGITTPPTKSRGPIPLNAKPAHPLSKWHGGALQKLAQILLFKIIHKAKEMEAQNEI